MKTKLTIGVISALAAVAAVGAAVSADVLVEPASGVTQPEGSSLVESGATDVASGMARFYWVLPESRPPKPARTSIAVRMGETDILAGMPEFVFIAVEPVSPELPFEATSYTLGATDMLDAASWAQAPELQAQGDFLSLVEWELARIEAAGW